jgi:hypothetical protein
MSDEQLIRALRGLDRPVDVDPGFDDALFAILEREYAGRHQPRPGVTLLLVAALLVALLVGGALAVGSGLLRLPPVVDRSIIPPGAINPCHLLLGDRYPPADRDEALFQSEFTLHDSGEFRWCRWPRWYEGWDGYAIPHVFLRSQPSLANDAEGLLPALDALLQSRCSGAIGCVHPGIVADGPWEWAAGSHHWMATLPTTPEHGGSFVAVAVSTEPYLFMVTARDAGEAYALASRIAGELGMDRVAGELRGDR